MSKNSSGQMPSSLRSRIGIAVGGLAVLNCITGLIAYLAASFFTSNTFFIVFATSAVTSVCTVMFGRWMANELLRPLEKVNLLAKSLERGSAVSLPKTTGASETDDLLHTLHRSSRQLQNLIGMMDSVSSGNTQTALTPIENSDRLSASFQKLVSKVTDSVDAAKELELLQTAVRQLTSDLAVLKSGNLSFEIRGGFSATSEISDAVRMLLARQSELVRQVRDVSGNAARASIQAKKLIGETIVNDTAAGRKLQRAVDTFRQNPLRIEKLSAEISAALCGAGKSVEDFETGKQAAARCSEAAQTLRKEISAAAQKMNRMDGQSGAIEKISKSADDLARRANLIALNASVQAGAANGGNISLIADEVAALSERASYVNKEVTIIKETINREIGQARASLKSLAAAMSDLSGVALEGDEAMSRLDAFFDGVIDVPSILEGGRNEISSDARQLLSVLDEFCSDAETSERKLRDCEELIAKVSAPMEDLKDSVGAFRTSNTVNSKAFGFSVDDEFPAHNEAVQPPEPLELQGEN